MPFFFLLLQSTALNGRWTPASPPVPTHPTSSSVATPPFWSSSDCRSIGLRYFTGRSSDSFPAEPPSLQPDAMNLLFGIYSGLWTPRSGCFEGTRCLQHHCLLLPGRMMKGSDQAAVGCVGCNFNSRMGRDWYFIEFELSLNTRGPHCTIIMRLYCS